MNKTKRQILDTALNLFNEHGLAEVSLRTIADEMKISPGNLTYHFKRREDIVEALYYEFVEAVDERFSNVNSSEVSLELIFELIAILTESRLRYRFLMRDFISLVAENPAIKKHYVSLLRKRKEQSMAVFDQLIDAKILRQAELNKEYENLFERIQILGNFWITSASMQGEKLSKSTVNKYSEVIDQIIYPYLTPKGIREYQRLK